MSKVIFKDGECLIKNCLIDNVLIIGSEKGYVYPYEITANPKDKKKVSFTLLIIYCSVYLIQWMKEER